MTQSTITGGRRDRGPNGKPGGRQHRAGRIDNLILDRRLGDLTWLGHIDQGDRVAALRLCATGDPPTEDVANVIDRAAALGVLRSPYLIPVLGAAWVEGAVWVVSEWDAGTSLRRLQQITWLTPAQAVVIGTEALSALRDLIYAGYAGSEVRTTDIRIDPGGHVRLTGWAAPNLLDGPNPRAGRECALAASALLTELATTARRSNPRATEMIAVLEGSAERLAAPGAGIEHIPGVAPELAATVEGVRLLQTRAELAALTQAARGPAPRVAAPPTRRRPPGVPSLPTRVRTNVRRTRHAALRWAIALTVLALAVGAEQLFLHGRIVHDLRTLIGQNSPSHTTPPAAHASGTAPAAVAKIAPAHAGVVKSVTLRPMRHCASGSPCRVQVLVHLRPHPHPVRVRWNFTVVNRCARTHHTAAGGRLRAPAHTRRIDGVSTVHLPSGQALAVVAVTHHPTRAASRPLFVPAGGGRC
jgi:hypothetical protein